MLKINICVETMIFFRILWLIIKAQRNNILSGFFCHFGLVSFMVLWQSTDTPVMSCVYVSALSRLRVLFRVGARCSDPGTLVLSFGFVSGFGHRAPCSVSFWEHAVSSLLGRVLLCLCVLCFVLLHSVRVLSAACIHVMSCAVWHAVWQFQNGKFCTNFFVTSFSSLSEVEVFKLILSNHTTTCPLDPIPSHLLQAISPALTLIVNTSLHTGVFPSACRQARITPLLKKGPSRYLGEVRYPSLNIYLQGCLRAQFRDHFSSLSTWLH